MSGAMARSEAEQAARAASVAAVGVVGGTVEQTPEFIQSAGVGDAQCGSLELVGGYLVAKGPQGGQIHLRLRYLKVESRDQSLDMKRDGFRVAKLCRSQDPELTGGGGGAGLVAEPLLDLQGLSVEVFGLRVVAPVLPQDAQLAIAGGGAGLVAEPLVDLQGLSVEVFGLRVVAPVLRQDAQLVVAGGGAGLVAEPLEGLQGLPVPAFGLRVVAPALRQDAQLLVPGGAARVGVGEQGQGVVDECGFPVPRPPGVQLGDDPLGDVDRVVGVTGLEQVVAGLEEVVDVGGTVLRPHLDPPLPVFGGSLVSGS